MPSKKITTKKTAVKKAISKPTKKLAAQPGKKKPATAAKKVVKAATAKPVKSVKAVKPTKSTKVAKPVKSVKTAKPTKSAKVAKPAKTTKSVKSTTTVKTTRKAPTAVAKKVGTTKSVASKTTTPKVPTKAPKVIKSNVTSIKSATKSSQLSKPVTEKAPKAKPVVHSVKAAKSTKTLEARVAATQTANLSTMGIPHYTTKPGEEYMNEAQRKHIERILFAWRQSLMEEVDRTVSHMKDEAANFPDSIDRASQEEEFSLELRTRDRERKLIKKIEDAMERLRSEDFGYCDTCGVEIGIARLEARPTATMCIDCKTLAEIKEKQTVGG